MTNTIQKWSIRQILFTVGVTVLLYLYSLAPALCVYDSFIPHWKGGVSFIHVFYRPVFHLHSLPYSRRVLFPWSRLWGVSDFIDDITYIDTMGFQQVLSE